MLRDFGVTRFLREFLPEWSTSFLLGMTMLGDLIVIVPLLGLFYVADVASTLYRSEEPPLCSARTAVLIAVVLGGLSLVVVLESVFAMPRPPPELHAVTPNERGFPSGHTMAATVFWGAVALWLPHLTRNKRLAIAAIPVLLVSFSRLALGVHYLPDVLASIILGTIYLAILARSPVKNPTRAFVIAIGIAILAVLVTRGHSRSILALFGTIGAAIGWWVIERPTVQRRLSEIPGVENNDIQ